MATEIWKLTPDEISLIDEVYNAGVLDEAGWARFYERVRTAPRREGAIESALTEEGIYSRLGREVHKIQTGISDPRHGLAAAEEHFTEKGIVGGLADIAAQAVTTPIRAGGQVLSGSLGETPLETLVGVGAALPVGRLAAGALGTGARMVGRRGAAAGLGQATRSPLWTNLSRGVEVGDVLTGSTEWPLEVIGEGMLDVGATGLGALARRVAPAQEPADDLSADGPPPDTPPQQPTTPPPQQQQAPNTPNTPHALH